MKGKCKCRMANSEGDRRARGLASPQREGRRAMKRCARKTVASGKPIASGNARHARLHPNPSPKRQRGVVRVERAPHRQVDQPVACAPGSDRCPRLAYCLIVIVWIALLTAGPGARTIGGDLYDHIEHDRQRRSHVSDFGYLQARRHGRPA